MKKLTSTEIRDMFLNYFEESGHEIISSASLIPNDDPTLLWNNAGVTPLKKYFDGSVIPENKRMVSCQKCIRTNDIESVGDSTHHTFFEMLGNFSIGDYFKKEAIEMSYELLTDPNYFGFDKEKLFVTIYPTDEEAYNYWINIGMPEDHIIRLENNYWEIGEGPCGPDSEIFYDRGEKYDPEGLGIKLLKEEIDNSRYVEIWNNVFSQYNSKEGLKREEYPELPNKNIDTGMGLERMVTIIQEKDSAYDTDLFIPIINEIEKNCNKKYTNQPEFRIIADHIRTLTFAISDGAVFSNEGRGYVLRRLLRRAARHGKKLGINEPFLYKLVDNVIDIMNSAYINLNQKSTYVKDLILSEEKLFNNTLSNGEKKLYEMIEKSTDNTISGEDAFKLYDTYGFPFELTLEYLEEKGYTVSKEDFDTCMNKQREMARNARKKEASMNTQNIALMNFKEESKFIGYEQDECETKIIGLFKEDKTVDELDGEGYIILESTPFYAEMGGQVSDTGYIYNDSCKIEVIEVIKAPNKQHLHIVNVVEGIIKKGDVIKAKINTKKREAICKNHSATHILQEALVEALNENISQAGSKVDEYSLRFDFIYPDKITEKDIVFAESLVNEKINSNSDTLIEYMSLEEAKKKGATALFDEKYEDIVRVITLFDSIELCGGTHVNNTKDINAFAIKSFESKGANTFRIEATTDNLIHKVLYEAKKPHNDEMIKILEKAKRIIDSAKEEGIDLSFNVSIDNSVPKSYKDIIYNRNEMTLLRKKVKELEKEYANKKEEKALKDINIFDKYIEKTDCCEYIVIKVEEYSLPILKQIIDNITEKLNNGFVFIANIKNDNVNFISKCNKSISNKINCGDLIKTASIKAKGNGGGSNIFGQGGGTDTSNIDEILEEIKAVVKSIK